MLERSVVFLLRFFLPFAFTFFFFLSFSSYGRFLFPMRVNRNNNNKNVGHSFVLLSIVRIPQLLFTLDQRFLLSSATSERDVCFRFYVFNVVFSSHIKWRDVNEWKRCTLKNISPLLISAMVLLKQCPIPYLYALDWVHIPFLHHGCHNWIQSKTVLFIEFSADNHE